MKYFLAFFLVTPLFASEYWMEEYGWGWGWSEAGACYDAQADIDNTFDAHCKAYSNGFPFLVKSKNYERCRCWEEFENDWRCDLYGTAICDVKD